MRLAVALAAASLVFVADASACTCRPVDLVRDVPLADGAFVGTVLERDDRAATATLRFRVEQVYKGEINNRIEVETARGGGMCGIEAPVGERLALLLERDGAVWRSSICSRVEPAAFLTPTDVEDNSAPQYNWPGVAVGLLILLLAAYALYRKRRGYRSTLE